MTHAPTYHNHNPSFVPSDYGPSRAWRAEIRQTKLINGNLA